MSAAATVLFTIALTLGFWGWFVWDGFFDAIQQQQAVVL
jgi:hypothetical protein